MRRHGRTATCTWAVLTAALVAATVASPASASAGASGATSETTSASGSGWVRSVAEPFTSPAGDLCVFPLQSDPLVDRVYVRTVRTFPDGSPEIQEYVGPLVVRLTNTTTGASIVRNLSGRAVVTFAADGSSDFRIQGPAAVGFRSANGDSLPTGFYVLRGVHVVHFAVDGTRTLTVDRGSEENTCATLA